MNRRQLIDCSPSADHPRHAVVTNKTVYIVELGTDSDNEVLGEFDTYDEARLEFSRQVTGHPHDEEVHLHEYRIPLHVDGTDSEEAYDELCHDLRVGSGRRTSNQPGA